MAEENRQPTRGGFVLSRLMTEIPRALRISSRGSSNDSGCGSLSAVRSMPGWRAVVRLEEGSSLPGEGSLGGCRLAAQSHVPSDIPMNSYSAQQKKGTITVPHLFPAPGAMDWIPSLVSIKVTYANRER